MASNQQFCLRWNNHQSTLISVFDHLLESGTLVDCTLAAEGQFLKAHKVVLSACSPYLEAILSQHYEKHPILILKDVTFHELKSMLDYMYRGEVNISQEQLGTFLKAAESLQIKGLTDSGAMSENRDFDRPRDLEPTRVDRTMGVYSKRMDMRKQIPNLPRSRSPLVGLPPNMMMNTDHRRSNKHSSFHQEVSSTNSNVSKSREGSISPTVKRKRSSLTFVPPVDDNVAINLPVVNHENNHEDNHQKENKRKAPSPVPPVMPNLLNCMPPSVSASKMQVDSEKAVESDVVKREVKSENVDFSDEVHNEDSVEDLTVEEEEEEMDEMDLSKPGPSNVSNSHVAGVPWHIAGEGNGEDLLLSSQPDSQDAARPLLECGQCHKTYSSPHTLRRHVRLECNQEPRFLCPYCPHRTKQRYNLMLHIGRTHRDLLARSGDPLDKRSKAM